MQLIESYQPEYVARFVALQETCNCPKCNPSPSQGREPFGDVCKILDLLLPLRRGKLGGGLLHEIPDMNLFHLPLNIHHARNSFNC